MPNQRRRENAKSSRGNIVVHEVSEPKCTSHCNNQPAVNNTAKRPQNSLPPTPVFYSLSSSDQLSSPIPTTVQQLHLAPFGFLRLFSSNNDGVHFKAPFISHSAGSSGLCCSHWEKLYIEKYQRWLEVRGYRSTTAYKLCVIVVKTEYIVQVCC
jgi:hypothetical protein